MTKKLRDQIIRYGHRTMTIPSLSWINFGDGCLRNKSRLAEERLGGGIKTLVAEKEGNFFSSIDIFGTMFIIGEWVIFLT